MTHLRTYYCRAYPHIKHRAKLDKLLLRAHISYLVGYKSTNIFRIWIPSLRRTISTRDVTFDEDRFYEPSDAQLLEPGIFIEISNVVDIIEIVDLPEPTYEIEEVAY